MSKTIIDVKHFEFTVGGRESLEIAVIRHSICIRILINDIWYEINKGKSRQ